MGILESTKFENSTKDLDSNYHMTTRRGFNVVDTGLLFLTFTLGTMGSGFLTAAGQDIWNKVKRLSGKVRHNADQVGVLTSWEIHITLGEGQVIYFWEIPAQKEGGQIHLK